MADAPAPRSSSRRRDFWQLHVPLALVLALCTVVTIIEVRRATEGVWRAWAYMVEWPMIGLFCIWIWNRYRKQGSVTRGLADQWRSRVERISAEAAADAPTPAVDDQGLEAWESYVDALHRRQPPGRPPAD